MTYRTHLHTTRCITVTIPRHQQHPAWPAGMFCCGQHKQGHSWHRPAAGSSSMHTAAAGTSHADSAYISDCFAQGPRAELLTPWAGAAAPLPFALCAQARKPRRALGLHLRLLGLRRTSESFKRFVGSSLLSAWLAPLSALLLVFARPLVAARRPRTGNSLLRVADLAAHPFRFCCGAWRFGRSHPVCSYAGVLCTCGWSSFSLCVLQLRSCALIILCLQSYST
jgi:hypothetical protein